MWKKLYFESCYMQLWKWKNFTSIIDNSVITCDEFIEEEIKTVFANFSDKNTKQKNSIFYLLFY